MQKDWRGTASHPCPKCDYKATYKRCLQSHIELIHRENCYHLCNGIPISNPCPKCDYKATYKCSLKSHIESIHRENCYHFLMVTYHYTIQRTLDRWTLNTPQHFTLSNTICNQTQMPAWVQLTCAVSHLLITLSCSTNWWVMSRHVVSCHDMSCCVM